MMDDYTSRLRDGLMLLAEEVPAVEMRDRALAGSRGIARRRMFAAAAAAAVVVVIAGAVWPNALTRLAEVPAIDGSPSVGPTLIDDFTWWGVDPQAFANATIVVPPWRTAACTAGLVTLTDGAHPSGIRVVKIAAGDIDGDVHGDPVAILACTHESTSEYMTVLYTRGPDHYIPLAQIQPADVRAMFDLEIVDDTVRIDVGDRAGGTDWRSVPMSQHHWRTYRFEVRVQGYEGIGVFVQTDGPTMFPANRPSSSSR